MNDVWILSERRTGSTYLCELLNGTGLFQNRFREWYVKFDHLNFVSDFYKCKDGCPYEDGGKIPNNGKIHWDTMKMMFESFENFIKKLSEPKFVRIIRENELDMAVSHAIAIKTKCYELRKTNQYDEWMRTKISISDSEIEKIYLSAKLSQKRWEKEINKKLTPSITVTYEKLQKEYKEEFSKVLSFIGIKFNNSCLDEALKNANNSIIKQNHPKKIELIRRFSKKIHI